MHIRVQVSREICLCNTFLNSENHLIGLYNEIEQQIVDSITSTTSQFWQKMAESLEGELADEMKVAENEIKQKERELYNVPR